MPTLTNGDFDDIVRRGKIRVGLFPSFMYARSSSTSELHGVAVAIGRLLGSRLGVEAEMVEYLAPPQVIAGLRAGACDVAFLGIDPARADDVDFSPPLMRADFTYIVPSGSSVATIEEADRAGTRIAVVRDHAMEIALRGKLKHAAAVYADTPDGAIALLAGGGADVSAGIRPGLIGYQRGLPGSRVLDGSYGSNTIAMAVLKGQPNKLARVTDFVRNIKATGAARQAVAEAGLNGVEVPAS